jgi:DNA-binding response OmpR family regulator
MEQKLQKNVILCIEDDDDIRTFCLRTLELAGYVCLHAEKPAEAIKTARNSAVNLVLLDLRLMEDDGWAILKKLKEGPRTAGIPVIVFTASYAISQKERALGMGAVEYLVKPLSARTLKDAITRVLPLK